MASFPKRRVIAQFTTDNSTIKEIEGLNVTFNIKKYAHGSGGEADISIANLAMPDINFLTTSMSPFYARDQRKKIAIYAGYDNDVNKIFEGCVCSAQPNKRGGDIWLDIKANKNIFNACTMSSKTVIADKKPMKIKELCSKVAEWAKLALDWKSKSTKTVDAFSFTGSISDAIRKINDLNIVYAFEDEDFLRAIDKNPMGNLVREFSEDSGMIGIPRLTQLGVDIRALMDSNIKIGERVGLKSSLIPSANGQYWVFAITYVGGLRDTEFYMDLCCRRNNYGTV